MTKLDQALHLVRQALEFWNGTLPEGWREQAKALLEPPPSPHPEHDKLAAIQEQSQIVGEFLEWLPSKEITLCWMVNNEYWPTRNTTSTILAEFFGIDLEKLEQEKRQMLDEIRQNLQSESQ